MVVEEDSDEDIEPPPKALEIAMPDCPTGYESLLGLFYDLGCVEQGSAGLIPLSYQEIKAFIELFEYDLTSFEIATIRKMSEAYCSESSKATDKNRPAPYNPEVVDEEENRKLVLSKAKSVFGRLIAHNKREEI